MRDLTVPGRVRDPSHGYVAFTGLERAILDHPVAQRLRHVSQSGMAHLVFPEVRSTRFAHSLGAMHLASRFFATALRNASPDIRADIQERLREAVNTEARMGLQRPAREEIENQLAYQGLRSGGSVTHTEYRSYAMLVEQGLRLAALFHDLGHLPFSHDFEYALQAAIRQHRKEEGTALPVLGGQSRLEIHETIGYQLASLLQHQIFGELKAPKWVETSFWLAEKILRAHAELDPDRPPGLGGPASPIDGLYQWLHSFIAGELDVDRCDYILRDTRHYGLDFASFDPDRLVDNVVACRSARVPDALFNSVLPQGQSALESFVIARYRMYQWGIFHHKVQQAAAALQKTTRDILRPGMGGGDEVGRFLDDIEAIASAGDANAFLDDNPGPLLRFACYDDVWWMTRLRQYAADHADDAWAQLVCRRAEGPVSLWKRRIEFPKHQEIGEFNARLPGSEEEERAAWDAAVDALEENEILVLRHRFQPWKSRTEGGEDSALTIRQPDGTTIPLTELSLLVAGLRESWSQDVQVQAFAERSPHLGAEEVVARLFDAMARKEPG